ncbi:hypothetical protein BH24GEM3_BH24GEM3_19660 [soil metagenome]
MAKSTIPPTQPARQLIDEYFIENRTRVLDIAAFLDRLDRAEGDGAAHDFRMRAFREALSALCDPHPDRTERIQMLLSDPTTEPLERLDQKSARGAYDRWNGAAD